MTRAAAPPILLQLQSSESVPSQVATLRALKNELIGHDQRKEAYVAAGIIPALIQVLVTHRPGKVDHSGSARVYHASEEADACLQAILIVGSLVQGRTPCLANI